jgi:hypothetical protein
MAPVANVANRMRPSAGSPNTLGGAGDGGGEDGCGEGGGDDGDGGGAAVSGAGIRGGGSSVVWEEDSRRGRTRVGATERVCLLRPKPPSSPVMNIPRMSSGVSHPACGAPSRPDGAHAATPRLSAHAAVSACTHVAAGTPARGR